MGINVSFHYGQKSWVLSGVAEGVQPLRGDTKDSSKTLSRKISRKLNTSLDMLLIFIPQGDKMTGER